MTQPIYKEEWVGLLRISRESEIYVKNADRVIKVRLPIGQEVTCIIPDWAEYEITRKP